MSYIRSSKGSEAYGPRKMEVQSSKMACWKSSDEEHSDVFLMRILRIVETLSLLMELLLSAYMNLGKICAWMTPATSSQIIPVICCRIVICHDQIHFDSSFTSNS